jgi:hypothetical protein
VPLFFPPLAGRNARSPPLDFARQRKRRSPHFIKGPASFDAHIDMDAALAGGLRPADEPVVFQGRVHHAGDLAYLRPRDPWHRIQIHAQFVRMFQIIGAHRMRMQLEAREIRHPGERCGIARHHLFRTAAGGKTQGYHFDPRWPRLRRTLLIEELARDAVRITHQHV